MIRGLGNHFLLRIRDKKVHKEEDRVFWKPSSCRTFYLKSLYSVLDHGDPILFPHGQRRFYAHPKMAFFAWEAYWEKILFWSK